MPVTVPRRVVTSVAVGALALLAGAGPAAARSRTAPGHSGQAAPATKYYVVSSSYQGQPEFLFEIAQRFLGNGNRAQDLFALNRGHQEPDGQTVSDPTVIRPGWILQLPQDANGDGVITGALPTVHFDTNTAAVKYYWIADGYQGQPEFLNEIAQRFLGDGNRVNDIFALNKGRHEPDGGILSDPAKVAPGWFVKLPDDAKGDGVVSGPLPFLGGAPAPGAQPSGSSAGASSAAGSSAPAGTNSQAAAGPKASRSSKEPKAAPGSKSDKGSSSSALVLIIVIGIAVLAVAGAAWWAVRRGLLSRLRGLGSRKRPVAAAPRDDAAAWTIDRVLRTLATACASAGRSLPGVAAVVIGADTLTLRLSAPDEQPPSGWSAEDQGRTWSATLRVLQSAPIDDELPAPYPRLVSAGDCDQGRVLLNLAEAKGMISLEGDARLTRPLAADWARELASSPWSRGVTVVRVGFAGSGGQDVVDAPSVDAARTAIDEADGGVLMLAHAPSGRDPERIVALAAEADGRWSVVVVGAPKNAAWRLTADAAGALDTGLLAEPVRLHAKARPLEHA